MWATSDDAKRNIVKAAKLALGLEVIEIGDDSPVRMFPAADMLSGDSNGIVDLGAGVCFKAIAA